MEMLVQQIARHVRDRVVAATRAQPSITAEWRSVFRGPPAEFLGPVYRELTKDKYIHAEVDSSTTILVPVLLLVDEPGIKNPPVGDSGPCSAEYLMSLRNSPACPRLIALVPPGRHTNLSFLSASGGFGMAIENSGGNATTHDWWRDHFVQGLVDAAIGRLAVTEETERDDIRQLVEHAVSAADEAERHDVARNGAWQVFARIFSVPSNVRPGPWVSLACGFPPMEDGAVSARDQIKVLEKLAQHLEEHGRSKGISQLKEDAEQPDIEALEAFSAHLQQTCEITTEFARAVPYYYGPSRGNVVSAPPSWWERLTVERWTELLEEEHRPLGAMRIECTNALFPLRGGHAVVYRDVRLIVGKPGDHDGCVDATLTRQISSKANTQAWEIKVEDDVEHVDPALPLHRAPARYSVEAADLKKATIKVISLETWEPGFFVYCRNARKISAPRQSKSDKSGARYECSLSLEGSGRHYVAIYARSTVAFEEKGERHDDSSVDPESRVVTIARSEDAGWGFEAEVGQECHYDLRVIREGGEPQVVRIFFTAEDVAAEGCKTEFERLIRLNRQVDGGRATTDVQLDRNVRCADLQTWLLSPANAAHSFYPLVMSTDYGTPWRTPDWSERSKAMLSNARFLHDPRPAVEEFRPPARFIEARTALAERIRGTDENGLVESARLGEWLASDEVFSEHLHNYLQSYLEWLESDPDIAPWVDTIAFCGLEQDRSTLRQEPEAIILTPLHPIRLAWHALAQRVLFCAYRKNKPCPAASILDPDAIPDFLALPLRTATGATTRQGFLAVECSSDYWGVMWNGKRVENIAKVAELPPFDQEFGVRIGGISSGFSLSQVVRSLDDVADMLAAKPVLTVMISSASGQTNACNEGIAVWCKDRLGSSDGTGFDTLGQRILEVLDLRPENARPQDTEISNLAEDTSNAVRWYAGDRASSTPDIGIIAQLETSNAREELVETGSPLGWGALLRHRVRRQLVAGEGAFLSESRVGIARGPTGDGLADKLTATVAKLENLSDSRSGFVFAPSVHAVQQVLGRATFAAVSSTAVDPACFLGNWLSGGYLWDYELPSYSHRSGDTNGYYLISRIRETDREALKATLAQLPGAQDMPPAGVDALILEVARRGIPTVRGLSSGNSGASGDLGLFIASRLLQDAFRQGTEKAGGLLPILEESSGVTTLALILPVDPFRGYLDDLQRAVEVPAMQRPDLLVAGIRISASECRLKLTPIEVKYRSIVMSPSARRDALGQAASLGALLGELRRLAEDQELVLWRLAFHHLLASMLSFGFRVYSQQRLAAHQSRQWTELHSRVLGALLAEEARLEVDTVGRLLVVDKSPASAPADVDEDRFRETIVLSPGDAATVLAEEFPPIYALIKEAVGDWGLLPALPPTGSEPPAGQGTPSAPPMPPASPSEKRTVLGGRLPDTPALPHPPADLSSKPEVGVRFTVGDTVDGFRKEPKFFHPSDTNLTQLNIGVVGDLGTGKTQLLKALIYRLSQSGPANRGIKPRILVFDYKKDYSDPDFVAAIGAKVVRPHRLPVNIFDIRNSKDSSMPWLDRFNFFSDVLDKIYSNIGPVQRKQLKTAVKQAYDACLPEARQPTIYDVSTCYANLTGGKPDAPSSILEDLVDREVFHPEPDQAESFESFLDGVVVINLASLGQDDRAKNMVVAVMLNLFYEHMLMIPKRPFEGTNPQLRVIDSLLLVDEADNIMRFEFDVLRKVLLQGREFGVGVILASQYLKHFKVGSTDYRDPLLTWFIHKVPNILPSELQALGMSADTAQVAERIKALPKHCCLYKTNDVPGDVIEGIPFYKLHPVSGSGPVG